jgi:PhzF family phenazine biosynthesis protein
MGVELTVVDAFTDRPFSGNPAAVALVEEFPDDERMQIIAAEMNLSETCAVTRPSPQPTCSGARRGSRPRAGSSSARSPTTA